MKKVILKKICLGFLWVLITQVVAGQNTPFTPSPDTSVIYPPPNDPTFKTAIRVIINTNLFDTGSLVTIPLPGATAIHVQGKKKRIDTVGKFSWIAMIPNDPVSLVSLYSINNIVSGRINLSNGKVYTIQYKGGGIHHITEVNPGMVKPIHDDYRPALMPSPPAPPPPPPAAGAPACSDPPNEVSLMVVYTQAALDGLGISPPSDAVIAMEANIRENVDNSNLSYSHSNVSQLMVLVHIEKVTYNEPGVAQTTLDDLEQNGDGILDNVHTLRDQFHADIVLLIVEQLDIAGLADLMTTLNPANESKAFCVVYRLGTQLNYVFNHELGHVMGCRHDNDPAIGPFTYNHGYSVSRSAGDNADPSFRTIMSVGVCEGSCSPILYWSNPSIDNPGTTTAMGSVTANNTRALNQTTAIVSQYRCNATLVQNVWMRDTYDDNGGEPDPNTAGESMAHSPYIWVRNNPDLPDAAGRPFPNQHMHENPIFGRSNWVYVKLHNGGPQTHNGNLKLYWAQASTGISWPGSWTVFLDTAMDIHADNSIIVETEWRNLPGTGHYCLLARWTADGDQISGETASISDNARNSNNIIWRNLNIIDLSGIMELRTDVEVRNDDGEPMTLVFSDDAGFPKSPFFKGGKVDVILSKSMFKTWKNSEKLLYNAAFIKSRKFRVYNHGEIRHILLKKNEKAKITLVFHRTKNMVRDKYNFTVKQYSETNGTRKYIGEVSYVVRTY